jgi:hypothetical protein
LRGKGDASIGKTFSSSIASLDVTGFGASQIFTGIQSGLAALSAAEKQKLVKKTNAVFAFDVTNTEKKSQMWFVDVKVFFYLRSNPRMVKAVLGWVTRLKLI